MDRNELLYFLLITSMSLSSLVLSVAALSFFLEGTRLMQKQRF